MGLVKKKISELTLADSLKGLYTIGYQVIGGVRTSVRVSLEFIQTAYEKLVTATDESIKATKDATAATTRIETLANHRDKIIDGEWWRWDEDTREYENTHESAKGNVLYASLEIDPKTGILHQITDPEYKGAGFMVENGILYSTINTK
jgi:hypothetical protein